MYTNCSNSARLGKHVVFLHVQVTTISLLLLRNVTNAAISVLRAKVSRITIVSVALTKIPTYNLEAVCNNALRAII
jgi:hypothetical protein